MLPPVGFHSASLARIRHVTVTKVNPRGDGVAEI